MLLRILQDEPEGKSTIILDLTNLTLMHDVGARMLFEGVDRLKQDGHKVLVVDSEGLLDKDQLKGRKRVVVTEELEKFWKSINNLSLAQQCCSSPKRRGNIYS